MARTKAAPRFITLPNPLPDGLTRAKVTRTEGEGDAKTEKVVEVLMVEESAAGIIALQNLVNGAKSEKSDPDGNTWVARAVNSVLVKSAEITDGKIEYPKAPVARTLDPEELFLETQRAFIRENRRPPNTEETAKMYADAFGS